MTQINKISRAMEIPPPPVTGESEDEWLDVRSLFRIVRRRLGIIILVTLAVLGAALPIILNIERDYSAAARILIHEPRPAALASSGLVSDNDLNLSTEQERLLSRKNAISVISELDLKNNPEFNPSLRREPFLARVKNGLRVALVGHPEDVTDGATSLDLVIQTYLGHLSITRSTGSEVVAIRFSSQDPQLAASVPNTLIRVYMEEREQRAAERLGRAEGWLKERIAEQRQRLSKVAAEADAFQEESQLALIDAQGAPETITGLKRRLANLVRERDELSAKLAQLENAQPDDLIEIVKSEVLLDLEREIDNEQVKVELLLDRYGSGHPEVLTANARIAGLEHSLENEIDRERERLAGEIEMLKREDAALHVALASAQRTLADGRRLDVTLGRLQLAADTERSALNRLEEQLRALQAEAELPVNEIEVLSPASVPLFADGRGRSYYLAAALFAASALAMTVAFFLEMIDKSVRSQEHLRKIQGLSPVGFLPSIGRQARRQILGGPKKVGRLYWDSVEAVVLALEQLNNGALPQSLLVTSALPGEGKSVTATALAAHIAASGRAVLLVDADLRNGELHRQFGASASPGFSDFLAGTAQLKDVVRRDERSGISFIPSGSDVASRRIDRQLVKLMIKSAEASKQLIIMDAPPVLVTSDALLLAGSTARTLLVVRWGRTSIGALDAAVARLSTRADRGIDAVLNHVNLRRQALYGYRDAGAFARSLRRYHSRFGRRTDQPAR